VAECCWEEKDEGEDGAWRRSGGSGSGRDDVISEVTILDVLGLQYLPLLFESVQNHCVPLVFVQRFIVGIAAIVMGWDAILARGFVEV
jgi:hypothetical protein